MSKIIIAEELKNRLVCAAYNGSRIASIIVEELKKGTDALISENANYFDSKRIVGLQLGGYKSLRIEVTMCNKDLSNDNFKDKGNPNAPYFKENRTSIPPMKFAKMFKEVQTKMEDGTLTGDDVDFFDSAIRVGKKLTVKLKSAMSDIEHAYLEDNYSIYAQDSQSSLHKSCMRNEFNARNVADFYCNFAGAKILVAIDNEGVVYGRAIVWPKAEAAYDGGIHIVSFVDRMYFSFGFVMQMMRLEAKKHVLMRKTNNDYQTPKNFTLLNSLEDFNEGHEVYLPVRIVVPSIQWHKKGAPYMDTMWYLVQDNDNNLFLSNDEYANNKILEFHSASGTASALSKYCPICGKSHSCYDDYDVCDECAESLVVKTPLGLAVNSRLKQYKDVYLPSECFDAGRIKKTAINWIGIQKTLKE